MTFGHLPSQSALRKGNATSVRLMRWQPFSSKAINAQKLAAYYGQLGTHGSCVKVGAFAFGLSFDEAHALKRRQKQ